jgi:hypothetical protein
MQPPDLNRIANFIWSIAADALRSSSDGALRKLAG